jgi:hypothetical protein
MEVVAVGGSSGGLESQSNLPSYAGPDPVRVPCRPGALLDFSWGNGLEMMLFEVSPAAAGGAATAPHPAGVQATGRPATGTAGGPFVSTISWQAAARFL